MSQRKADEYVAAGAALLDEKGPAGWRGKVEPERLDMYLECTLDHIYPRGYTEGLLALGLSHARSAVEHGFSPSGDATDAELRVAWAREVRR